MNRIELINKEIERLEKKIRNSTGREVYSMGTKLRVLKAELLELNK